MVQYDGVFVFGFYRRSPEVDARELHRDSVPVTEGLHVGIVLDAGPERLCPLDDVPFLPIFRERGG